MGWHASMGGRRFYRKKIADRDEMNAAIFKSPRVEESNEMLLLDLDNLYQTRQDAIAVIYDNLESILQFEFLDRGYGILLNGCLGIIARGFEEEIPRVAHLIGLLVLVIGPGKKAEKIMVDSIDTIMAAVKKEHTTLSIISLLQCWSLVTFFGCGSDPATHIARLYSMLSLLEHKVPAVVSFAVYSWAFILTSFEGYAQDSTVLECLSSLLDTYEDSRIGQAIVLTFEFSSHEKIDHNNVSKNFLVNLVRGLSAGAGKECEDQKKSFRDVLYFLEYGCTPKSKLRIGGHVLETHSFAQQIQLNYLWTFLQQGFLTRVHVKKYLIDAFVKTVV